MESEKDYREKLLRMVKKEVKQIMEEAVTRKFVHEESSSITSLCVAVDACLSHGLKRRALGLFKTNSTTALLQKVAKNFEPAAIVYKAVIQIETSDPSNDSTNQLRNKIITNSPTKTARYLWIRVALFEKQLVDIVTHVVTNHHQYYEKEALVADPVDGQILASLLVGPCALDYSKMKTQDHYWTDPPADELVQRNRLVNPNSNGPSTPPVGRKPLGLPFRRGPISDSRISSSSDENLRLSSWSPRDYVESLHQNCKTTLLYGKNNVLIQPRENLEAIPGYLSLHQTPAGLVIKWTPNQLMNGSASLGEGSPNENTTNSTSTSQSTATINNINTPTTTTTSSSTAQDKNFWDYAMTVNVEDIVYLHCHQQDSCGTVVLVGQDGVQRSPIRFPKGGHLLAFLSCLENGLAPYGQMVPPLWTRKGKGKVFPKLKRKNHRNIYNASKSESGSSSEENETTDYVFRIVASSDKPETISQEMFDPKTTKSSSFLWRARNGLQDKTASNSSSTSSTSSTSKSLSEDNTIDVNSTIKTIAPQQSIPTDKSIKILCDTMKRQIISRAFYGWLAHCRHLRTVRTHLSGLVNAIIIPVDKPNDASKGLTKEAWESFHDDNGRITNPDELRRLIYYGGIDHDLRRQVWPYLLGHYEFEFTSEERTERDKDVIQHYEITMTDWLAVEAIVRQRDKEIMAANLAKLSSESNNSTEMPLIGPKETNNCSGEVFTDFSDTEESGDDAGDKRTDKSAGKPGKESKSSDKIKLTSRGRSVDSVHGEGKGRRKKVSPRDCLKRQRQIGSETSSGQNIVITNPSVDLTRSYKSEETISKSDNLENDTTVNDDKENKDSNSINDRNLGLEPGSACISPASSNGGVYPNELLDLFSLNIHRIDKDVQRCDRNYWYFMNKENLEKLRNVMCTYVWEHLDQGYVQGMCDLVAPLLVIFDDEVKSYSCFCELMKRMVANFPHGGAMDTHFANMRSLIQILDNEIFDLMHQNGDYTHFYFCYRWFLLDFKRELLYEDIFRVWEVIWAAKFVASAHFVLFIALALVEYYRDIILENDMDFTDIIKFFNEMAERHDAKAVLKLSRELVLQIQSLMDNNYNYN
ncbi:small G protein signaling modulator 2-like isoform X3 [Panonychus citri]|uniref:small G protein signaling modulator 2-like isoform X3 n=1 Tax=Panonychus citri TaxID=50023 RepID=UPI002307BF29|nr:small G protein signaling modulator 2-like isoform X3 [Panonychus citri]